MQAGKERATDAPVRWSASALWWIVAGAVAGASARLPARAQATAPSSSVSSRSSAAPTAAPTAGRPIAERGPAHFADRTSNLPNEPITAIAVDPSDDAIVYAGLDGFVFMSDDGGESWRPVLSFARGLADDGSLNDTAVDAFDSGTNGQAINDPFEDGAGGDGGGAGVGSALDELDTTDNEDDDDDGDRFVDADPATGGGLDVADDPVDVIDTSVAARVDVGVRAFAFVPGSPGVVLVATPRGIFRTTDSARSFERIRLPGGPRENDVRDVAIDPTRPTRLWVGTAAGLSLSLDGGASVGRVSGRVGTIPIVDLALDDAGAGRPPHLLVASERGLLRSRDDGETFADLLLQGSGAFPVVHSVAWVASTDTVYAGVADGLFVGQRGAAILERYPAVPAAPPAAISPDPLWGEGLAVAVRGGLGGVVFSDDGGMNLIDVDVLPSRAPMALARESRDPTRVWVATERGVFRLEPGTGIRVGGDTLVALRARFAREPDLTTITERVLRNHGFLRDDDDLRARASIASWLPTIRFAYDAFRGDATQTRNTVIFRDPSTLPAVIEDDGGNDLFGDGLSIVSPSQAVWQQLWVQLTWDLDRAILNPQVLRSARQLPLLRNAERRLVDDTRQLFITRRRLIAELSSSAARASTAERVWRELRLMEIEALLEGLADEAIFSTPRARAKETP
jgi:hypothetical protein